MTLVHHTCPVVREVMFDNALKTDTELSTRGEGEGGEERESVCVSE